MRERMCCVDGMGRSGEEKRVSDRKAGTGFPFPPFSFFFPYCLFRVKP